MRLKLRLEHLSPAIAGDNHKDGHEAVEYVVKVKHSVHPPLPQRAVCLDDYWYTCPVDVWSQNSVKAALKQRQSNVKSALTQRQSSV